MLEPKEALILLWVHITYVYVCRLTLGHVSTNVQFVTDV